MMEQSKKILILSNIVLVGFVIAVFFHYVLGFYLNLSYPYNTFLFNPNIRFSDFTNLLETVKNFAPYTPPGTWSQYFPLVYLMIVPFLLIKFQVLSYLLFFSIFAGFFIHWNIKNFYCENLSKMNNFSNIFILTCLSYPFLAVIDRGNFDMIIFIFFTFFVFAFQEGKYQKSAIFLGIINAMKPFSLIFLVLFLYEKKYREFFLSLAVSFFLIIGGFMLFKGGVFDQITVMLQGIILLEKRYVLKPDGGMSNSSSLFMALKLLFFNNFRLISLSALINLYKYISLFLMGITILFAWREKVFWKRILLLTLYMLTVPSMVFDYKLIFIFVPLWLFINAKEKSKFDLAYLILFSLILIPKRFFLIWVIKFILLSVIINPLVMLALMGLVIFEQFKTKEEI